MNYDNNIPLRVFTSFSGYDSQCMALDRLKQNFPDFDYELIGWSEIDKYAIQAHDAIYPQYSQCNYGDITKIDWEQVPDFDLFTYSFPCTDISNAGKQMGLSRDSGTRSSLLWECEKAIEIKKPKYLLMENVSALLSDKFKPQLKKWCDILEGYGYKSFYKILNAKQMGVPQNRARVFMLSTLDHEHSFYFPKPFKLERRLKDVLEKQVDEKLYLSQYSLNALIESTGEQLADGEYAFSVQRCGDDEQFEEPVVLGWVRDENGNVTSRPEVSVANCVTSGKRDNTQNYVVEQCFLNGDKDGCASTITTGHDRARNITEPKGGHKQMGVLEIMHPSQNTSLTDIIEQLNQMYPKRGIFVYRGKPCFVRRLSVRELYRLMDVDECCIDVFLSTSIPKTQHAKMAGNSIVVNVLYHIFKKLFIETEPEEGQQLTLF